MFDNIANRQTQRTRVARFCSALNFLQLQQSNATDFRFLFHRLLHFLLTNIQVVGKSTRCAATEQLR